jgi:hypothetical protein
MLKYVLYVVVKKHNILGDLIVMVNIKLPDKECLLIDCNYCDWLDRCYIWHIELKKY